LISQLYGYIFARSFRGERVPQHVQNIVLRDYCSKHEKELFLAAVEYAMPNSFVVLNSLIDQMNSSTGLIFYSLCQLPESFEMRTEIYQRILDSSSAIHFAVENCIVNSLESAQNLERIIQIRDLLKIEL